MYQNSKYEDILTKLGIIFILIILNLYILFLQVVYSKTAITVDTLPIIETIDTDEVQSQVQDIADLNGPIVAEAFALSNITGYPIGKSYLGTFPHFELGISIGAGCANMEYFNDDDPANDNGSFPCIFLNPVVHFGLGLGGGMDVLAKFFYFDKTVKDPGLEYDIATLSDFKVYSIGGKLRYNYISKKELLPFILKFGGINFSIGADFMYGDVSVVGEYDYTFEDIDLSTTIVDKSLNVQFEGDYDAVIEWSIFSLTAQVLGYLDILYFFSFYSGFGLTCNIASFSIKFNGYGELTSDDEEFLIVAPDGLVGSLDFKTENEYRPYPLMPTYVVGLEINLFILKINFETMVNLRNSNDVNAQFGLRLDI